MRAGCSTTSQSRAVSARIRGTPRIFNTSPFDEAVLQRSLSGLSSVLFLVMMRTGVEHLSYRK